MDNAKCTLMLKEVPPTRKLEKTSEKHSKSRVRKPQKNTVCSQCEYIIYQYIICRYKLYILIIHMYIYIRTCYMYKRYQTILRTSSAALIPALRTNPLGQHRQDSPAASGPPVSASRKACLARRLLGLQQMQLRAGCVCDVCVCPQTLQYFVPFQISPQFRMRLMIYLSRVSSRQQQQRQQTIGKQLAQQDGQGKK